MEPKDTKNQPQEAQADSSTSPVSPALPSNQNPSTDPADFTNGDDTKTNIDLSPTRTMASDEKRASTIESDRDLASKAAIDEIRALEEALASATKDLKPEKKVSPIPPIDPINDPEPKSTPPIVPNNDEAKSDLISVDQATMSKKEPSKETAEVAPTIEIKEEKHKNRLSPGSLIEEIKEEVAASGEDTRIATLKTEIARIEKSKLEFIQRRGEFTKKEQPIKKNIETIKQELETAQRELEPFDKLSQQAELEIAEIEQQEKNAANPEAKHLIENKRWGLEDKRHKVEEQKWGISRKIEAIIESQKKAEADLEKVLSEALSTDKSIAEADRRINELGLEIKLVELGDTKQQLEKQWVDKNNLKREADSELEDTRSQEELIEEQVSQLHKNTLQSTDPSVTREYEQERHRLSLERRDLEKKRWSLEQRLRSLEQDIEELKPKYQKALEDEKRAVEELDGLRVDDSDPSSSGGVRIV